MITALVLFKLPDDMSAEQLAEHFRQTAVHWSEHPRLLHKSYLYDPQLRQGGASFVWPDRAAADSALDDTWRAQMVAFYGSEPAVRMFETPLMIAPTDRRGIIGDAV